MIIVSGLSGAGKTVALHALEDLGYYCIDNLPVTLLPNLLEEENNIAQPVAVGIDVRSHRDNMEDIPNIILQLKAEHKDTQVLFLNTNQTTQIKRFSESRRKHPLSDQDTPLAEAIALEKRVLLALRERADCQIDTSTTNIYELKDCIKNWLKIKDSEQPLLTIESFGFKNGVPVDADLMFDVRFLPNPHWESELRPFTGKDPEIQNYLAKFDECERFIADTASYLTRWIPNYFSSNRTYLTVAIGCTGGKHRSVYISEQLCERLSSQFGAVTIRHRDLPHSTRSS